MWYPFLIFAESYLEMEKGKKAGTSPGVRKGIHPPPAVNPVLIHGRNRKRLFSAGEYVDGILSGSRIILSEAITLVESSLPGHSVLAREIIDKCLPYSGNSVRIGITGIPGAGKSTFIETFGLHLIQSGKKVAVLAIDPSSRNSGGSILGDKTRMNSLSTDPNAFIRPSPSAGTPGGVAARTRESILLCEAAGFDIVIVETVGVGQSETAVRSMVDFFLLLMLAGTGDELQGIKRGIMEIADAVVINKADGDNVQKAELAKHLFQNALNLFQVVQPGWHPRVLTCSALEDRGIDDIIGTVGDFISLTKKNGFFDEQRKEQAVIRMHDTIIEVLKGSFYCNEKIKEMMSHIEQQLREGETTPFNAAMKLTDVYFGR